MVIKRRVLYWRNRDVFIQNLLIKRNFSAIKNRILHSCFRFTEFIKLVGENDKMFDRALHLIFFPNSFNKFSNT